MLRSYWMAALRDLSRNRAYALINVCGLALGFAAAIVIALYVRDEYSYDRFWPAYDRIFKVDETFALPGNPPLSGSQTVSDVARSLKLEFPSIDLAVRVVRTPIQLRRGDIDGVVGEAYWADRDFFRIFPLKTITGDPNAALGRPDEIVLTQSIARRFFGRDDVVGQTIELNRAHVMRVGAVIEDLPSNTHLSGEVFLPAIASFSELSRLDSVTWGPGRTKSFEVYTYVRLRPGTRVEPINSAMRAFVRRHFPGEFSGVPIAQTLTMTLSPVTSAHLGPRQMDAMKPQGDRRTLHALIGIACLIVFIAASNFVGMMTARTLRRSVEVGVRKAVGATRRQIILQFVGECLFYVAFALGVALAAVELLLPGFNAFLQRDIHFDYIDDPRLGAAMLGFAAIVGLAAGAYPALVLSRFRPNEVLRGTSFLAGGSGRLREALVAFQFATLIGLIVVTLTVARQERYAIEDRLRLPNDEIYMVFGHCPQPFADTVARLPGVEAVSCTSSVALAQSHWGAGFVLPNGGTINLESAQIDYRYFRLFGIKPLAGRLFTPDHGEDDVLRSGDDVHANPTVVLNESAIRALGFTSPQAAVGQFRRWSRPALVSGAMRTMGSMSSEIVGVVPDFSIGSIRDRIEPTAYYIDPEPSSFAAVMKLSGRRIPEAVRGIKELWSKTGPQVPFTGMFLSQYFNDLYADIERQTTLFVAFSMVAVAIAVIGLLGLALFTAEYHTKEIGLRKVMGARRRDILGFLLWQFARPVLWGNVIAWPCAYLFTRRWLEGFAYHVALGPGTFAAAGSLAILVALATVVGHALLVARARPVEALRYE